MFQRRLENLAWHFALGLLSLRSDVAGLPDVRLCNSKEKKGSNIGRIFKNLDFFTIFSLQDEY
jgi:hypothetical protein